MLGTLKVQRKPNTLVRIAKTVAAVAAALSAAVAMKKEQRLPCPKGRSRPINLPIQTMSCSMWPNATYGGRRPPSL